MDLFELMRKTQNYELTFYEEPSVALRAIIAINNTVLGPVLATTKIFDFQDVEKATNLALNTAYYNTFRSALLRKQFGGGSIVLCGDPQKVKNEFYLRALGIYINKFAGKLLLAPGSELTQTDIQYIWRETDYVLGFQPKLAISPALAIAKGIIWGIKAAVKEKLGKDELSGLSFVIQGIDKIGYHIVEQLLEIENIKITITDRIYDRIKEIQDRVPDVNVVKPSQIYKQKCDVFISCSFDKTLDPKNAELLQTEILTGSVNNLIDSPQTEQILQQKNILYLPGYVINGGDIILFENQILGGEPQDLEEQLSDIYSITQDLIRKAAEQKQTINQTAIQTAKQYIENISAIKKLR